LPLPAAWSCRIRLKPRHELNQRSDGNAAQTVEPHRAQRTRPHQLVHLRSQAPGRASL